MTTTTTAPRTIPATPELATWSKRLLLTLCHDHGVTNLPLGASNGTLVKVLAKHRDARGLRPAEPAVSAADLAGEAKVASGMSTRQLVIVEMEQGTLNSLRCACHLAGLTGVDTSSGGAMGKALTAWLNPRDTVAAKATAQTKAATAPDSGKLTPETSRPAAPTGTVGVVKDPRQDGNGTVKCFVQSTSNDTVFGVATALQCLAGAFSKATNLTDLDMLLEWAKVAHTEHKARLTVKPAVTPIAPTPVPAAPVTVAAKTVETPKATVVVSPNNTDLPKGPIAMKVAMGLGKDTLAALGKKLGLNVDQYTGKGYMAKLAAAVSKASKGLAVPAPVVTATTPPAAKVTPTVHPAGTVLVSDGKGGVAVATLAQRLAGLNADEVLAFLTK